MILMNVLGQFKRHVKALEGLHSGAEEGILSPLLKKALLFCTRVGTQFQTSNSLGGSADQFRARPLNLPPTGKGEQVSTVKSQ